jgi:hypothetical protein
VAVVHELAHIADLGWQPSNTGHAFAFEGFATFISTVFPDRRRGDPFASNLASHPKYGDGASAFCVVNPSSVFSASNNLAWNYGPGCNFAGYLFTLRRSATGETFQQMASRWSSIQPPTTLHELVERFLGPEQPALRFAEWFLSWYADDFVPGTSSVLDQPYWNPRAFWATWLSGFGPYPLPHAVLGASPAYSDMRLAPIDARFIEFTAVPGTRLRLRATTALPGTSRFGMLLLRR